MNPYLIIAGAVAAIVAVLFVPGDAIKKLFGGGVTPTPAEPSTSLDAAIAAARQAAGNAAAPATTTVQLKTEQTGTDEHGLLIAQNLAKKLVQNGCTSDEAKALIDPILPKLIDYKGQAAT